MGWILWVKIDNWIIWIEIELILIDLKIFVHIGKRMISVETSKIKITSF